MEREDVDQYYRDKEDRFWEELPEKIGVTVGLILLGCWVWLITIGWKTDMPARVGWVMLAILAPPFFAYLAWDWWRNRRKK